MTIHEIPTPALLFDLDAFEENLQRLIARVKQAGKGLRPHAKAHKCVEIAKRQLRAGACGVCVATLAEAEMMARAGIDGLLLTSPVADAAKMARIAATGAMVVVDHEQQATWYEEAARAAGRTIDVLVDLDVGDHRTGAVPVEAALKVAHAVDRSPHLRLRGVQAYSVSGSHASGEERRRNSEQTFRLASATRDAMTHDGLCADIVSGGSTGTWEVDAALPDVTELQAGSFVAMDLAYRRLGLDLRLVMTVLTTVISANHQSFVTVDGGFKAFSTDRAYGPEALDLPGSKYRWGGDEFGYLDAGSAGRLPKLGERIEFIAPHCDPTVNLYDRIHVRRGDEVLDTWSVMDRMR